MNEATLPPSPNWYLGSILSCAKDGTVAWGARNCIVVARNGADEKSTEYSLIRNAHDDRVTSVAFSPEYERPEKKLVVSGGDEHIVRIWNVETLSAVSSQEFLDNKQKVIGVDWSACNPDLICFVSSEGVLMSWTVSYNACQQYSFGKLPATCLTCSPHKSNIVAIGAKNGLIHIVNLQGNGTVNYKLRGHDVEITSLSWCPVEENIFNDSGSKDMLLASGAKDRSIFVWRAGGDGRSQMEIATPTKPMDSNQHRVKLGPTAGNWTAVCWAEPKFLLASSSWGELVSYDFTMGKSKPMCKLQHAKHARGLFCIATVPKKTRAEEENWRESNPLIVWTLAQDRQVIRSSITATDCKTEYSVPTQGGYVYCMAACPLDTSRIAFGVGDAMLRLWNLSEPHDVSFDVTVIWQKIMGKVRSLAWHPEKENMLAFGTGEGRVGVCDTHANKPPILHRQHHRHTVYSIGWGPKPNDTNDKNFVLYSCGDGELVYYISDKSTKEAKTVVKKGCTEFAWKPDYSCVAVGYEGGSISFLNRNLKQIGQPIYCLKKAVQSLAWHPDSTATDLNFSPLRNYLAVAVNASTITVFDLTDLVDGMENASETPESGASVDSTVTQHKIVANLCGHTQKVVCLAWSPHFSGHLISGSYDATAQVWKVETQELLATYTGHTAPVQSCMWSPLDPDYVITGSTDFTLRVWKVSDRKPINPTEKPQTKRIRTKNQRGKKPTTALTTEPVKTDDATEIPKEPSSSESKVRANTESPNGPTKEISSQKFKKERSKKSSYLAAYTRRMNEKSVCSESLRNLAKKIHGATKHPTNGTNGTNGETNGEMNGEMNGETNGDTNGKTNEISDVEKKYASIFGSIEDIDEILQQEKSSHASQGQHNVVTEMSLWNNGLRKNLEDATRDKRLNDYLVSLSSSLSMKTWQETCEAYATQLTFEGNPTKAVSYLLCVHKIHRAVETFVEQKMYREAYVLARCKLDAEDPIVPRILKNWASNAAREGNFEDAAHCCVKLGEFGEAARFMSRRKNLDSLEIAAELAVFSDESGLSESLADQAFTEALLADDCDSARRLIEKFPQIIHRQSQIEVFEEMKKAVEINAEFSNIFDWLNGKNEYGLMRELRQRIGKYSVHYDRLTANPNSAVPDNKSMLWLVVSHHFAMAASAPDDERQTRHVVAALGVISQYETVYGRNSVKDGTNGLAIRVISILEPNAPMNDGSLFARENNPIWKSLRAYLCHALLDWFAMDKITDSEILNGVLEVIEKLFVDVMDPETVRYWTTKNEVNKLETALACALGKSQKGEDDEQSKEDTTVLIEKLNGIRSARTRFVEERVCAPSPIFAYSKAFELANGLTHGIVKDNFTKIVSETWSKATS